MLDPPEGKRTRRSSGRRPRGSVDRLAAAPPPVALPATGEPSPATEHRRGECPIEPFYTNPEGTARLYQGDCLDVMSRLPEYGTIMLIFADPPYFLSNDGITCRSGRMVSVNKGTWDRLESIERMHTFNRTWVACCRDALGPDGSLWVSGTRHVIHSVGFAMQQLGMKLLNDISWEKPNPPPNLSCRYFTHSTETLLWAARDERSRHIFDYRAMRAEAGGKQMKSVWTIPTPGAKEKEFGNHPTQKPLALLERIISACSRPGDLVLDPFAGSGTTGVAAQRLGRRFVGIELDAGFAELAARRLQSAARRSRDSASPRRTRKTSRGPGAPPSPPCGSRRAH